LFNQWSQPLVRIKFLLADQTLKTFIGGFDARL
jgi:hypothetical protein